MMDQANDEVRDCLGQILAQNGVDIRSDPERLEGLLRECCPEHSAQIFALTSLARQGIVDQLVGPRDIGVRKLLASLTARTVSELGLGPRVARWSVDSWAVALGVTRRRPARGSGPPPPSATDEEEERSPVHSASRAVRIVAAVGALATLVLVVVALRYPGSLTAVHANAIGGDSPRPAASTSAQPPTAYRGTDMDAVARALARYYSAINRADYHTAWMEFTPQQQARIGSEQAYAAQEATSQVISAELQGVSQQSAGVDLAMVTFVTHQSPVNSPDGQECDTWSLVYTMVEAGGGWRIDRAAAASGTPYGRC
jgi:hypothetical protein